MDGATHTDKDQGDANPGLVSQLAGLTRATFTGRVGKKVIALLLAAFAVIGATAYFQIRLNLWNKPFYDALSRRDLHDFMVQLGVFFILAAWLTVLNVAQRWIGETLKLKLREALAMDLLEHWLQPRRAFWLASAGAMGENPDQRMHEDARHLCELTSDLGLALLQSSILLVSFSGVLWVLSSAFVFRIGEHDYAVPGFMLWAAIIYALTGSLISYWVGHGLIARNAFRYAREADFRVALVRVNEHLDDITLAGGEADELRRIETHLDNVLAATRRIVSGLTNLTWVTAGFGWITNVAPILVAAPLYFTGKISFGGLMMAAAAFTQAQSSLRWFVDNFSTIADWRATLLRVASFRDALVNPRVIEVYDSKIQYQFGDAGTVTIDNLVIQSSAGEDGLQEPHVVVHAGERVIIAGAPGTNRTQLFRALAGLWPWGHGQITRPQGEVVQFVPRGSPYLPRGTLREVLAYPQKITEFKPEAFEQALRRMKLKRLLPLLDEVHRWDRELNSEEQVAVALARVVVHVPNWVLMDGTLSTLPDEFLERISDALENELKYTAVVHIGPVAQVVDHLFRRVVHLVKLTDTGPAQTAETRILPQDAAP
ncbi:MAG TPA: ABC transporter ATP-binding protein/permease [Steroidobacteraceae bacterium]|jgi:putative ATP-binding cassette transporter|nr:ABC transporter ATP-binding protein/permease [Steroidobacteraceae bacterium]